MLCFVLYCVVIYFTARLQSFGNKLYALFSMRYSAGRAYINCRMIAWLRIFCIFLRHYIGVICSCLLILGVLFTVKFLKTSMKKERLLVGSDGPPVLQTLFLVGSG